MKKIRWLALFVAGAILWVACLCFFSKIFRKGSSRFPHAKEKLGNYFFPLEVSGFNQQGSPYLVVKIEDLAIPLMLDLGDAVTVSLSEPILKQLQTKSFFRLGKLRGLRGRTYECKEYNLPNMEIGMISFSHLLLCEEPEEFCKDAIISNQSVIPSIEKGRVGWGLFTKTNLFLDLGNKRVAICDSLQTLGSNGYAIETFIKVPLFPENKLIEIETEIDGKKLRSVLDTGSTWNLFNSVKEGGRALDDSAWTLDAPIMTTSLSIGSQSFDPITWHLLPICLPFSVDAILGMDFFQAHLVFLDFSENMAYIAKLKG